MWNRLLTLQKRVQSKRGFTLIEFIVATGIFVFVMLVAASALMGMVRAAEKARSFSLAYNSLNTAMETVLREMSLGTNYHCGAGGDISEPKGCNSRRWYGGDTKDFMAFEPAGGNPATSRDQMIFRHNNGTIEMSRDGGRSYVPMLQGPIVIEQFSFFSDDTQYRGKSINPPVIIIVYGYVGEGRDREEISLQTTVYEWTDPTTWTGRL